MKNDKSIDGLNYRSTQKTKAKSAVIKQKTTTRSSAKRIVRKPVVATKTTVRVATKPTVKATTKPIAKPAQPTTPPEIDTKPVEDTKPIEDAKPDIKKTTHSHSHEEAIADFLKPVQAFDFDGVTGNLKESTTPKDTKKEFNISNEKTKSKKRDEKEKKKPSKARRIITIVILSIVLILIGLVVWAIFWGNDIIAKITGGQGNVFDLVKFIEPTYDPLKTDANGRTNILAFGTSGYDMSGDEGDGVHDGAQLTDSIMMISLNQETGDIAMLSLPRDLKASPTCTATGKINEVYWCNGGKADISTEEEAAAATALMAEVGSILGVEFQYFAHLNWGSLISIVDTLDGIEVTLDEDINDAWWTGAVYEAGVTYTLNGEEALGLARARHGTAGGDFSRGASQQKILIGIKNKIFEKDLSLMDIISLASTLGDNFRSNFSIDELKSAAHLTFEFDFDSMRQISLWPDFMTTGSIDGISYVLPRAGVGNYSVIQEYVSEQTSNDPRVYEYPTIAVLNATDTVGLAASETAKLEEAGYRVNTTDNAPEDVIFTDDVTIFYNGSAPGTKAMLEKQYENIEFKPISEAPESINHDYTFVIILGGVSEQETQETQQ